MLNGALRQRSVALYLQQTERAVAPPLRGKQCVRAQSRSTAATSTKTGKRRAKRRVPAKLEVPPAAEVPQQEEAPAAPAAAPACDAVVELNVGGTLMSTFLSTLTQVRGSRLARMFAAPAQLQRDTVGRVFLDYDPHCFALLLKWLRDRRMQQEAAGAALLQGLTAEEQHHLAHLVQHLELAPHHPAPTPLPLLQKPPSPKLPRPLTTPLVQPVAATGGTVATAPGHHRPTTRPAAAKRPHAAAAAPPACAPDHSTARTSCPEAGSNQHRGAPPRPSTSDRSGSAPQLAAALVGGYQAPSRQKATPATSASGRSISSHAPAGSSSSSGGSSSDGGGPSSSSRTSGSGDGRRSGTSQWPLAAAATGQAQQPGVGGAGASALYYVMAGRERRKGLRISVFTERDLAALRAAPRFDLFCDASFLPPNHTPLAMPTSMALSVVATRDLHNLFLGITSRAHTDQRGTSVPCYGWKQLGCRYSSRGAADGAGSDAAAASALWRKGDCVEVRLQAGAGLQLQLRVNGELVDVLQPLPQLAEWCWYLGLYTHGDLSSVVLHPDSYAVYWGDYHIRRYL